MIFLSNLRPYRIARNIKRADLVNLTLIADDRLRDIDLARAEPWFDEALAIARTMNCSVHDLLAPADIKAFEDDPRFFAVDLKYWYEGVRLPLSIAMRLRRRFGLTRIDDLDQSALIYQLWSVMEASERHPEAPGWCVWCQADIADGASHKDHCLPHNLLGARALGTGTTAAGTADAPLPGMRGRRTGSARVPGLRRLRERLGLTQVQMARELDFNPNHYARIERGELPLTLAKASQLGQQHNIPLDFLLTADPVGLPDNSGAAS